MSPWLCIASDYTSIRIALCCADTVVESVALDKKFGNQRLLIDSDLLLKRHGYTMRDMHFIGVNLGPAPYTSLRIAIATANGLHAATGIPLVGIDALKAFIAAYAPTDQNHITVALLNAFNNDLFYAIARYPHLVQTGYEKSEVLLERIARDYAGFTIRFIGNGVLPVQEIAYPTNEQLAAYAWRMWQQNETADLALPLYLKQIQ